MAKAPDWKRPLTLAVVLMVLATLTYWLEYSKKPKDEEKREAAKRIFDLKDKQIRSIVLKKGGQTVELACTTTTEKLCRPGDNSKWEMLQPKKLKADDANVNSLVSSLSSLSSSDTIDLKEEDPKKKLALLQEYKLDPDTRKGATLRSITVETADHRKTEIDLGDLHPLGDSVFALKSNTAGQMDDNEVYLVSKYANTQLEKDLSTWRDKKLITLSASEATGFQLWTPKTRVSGERKHGEWTLKIGNEQLPGDSEAIDGLISAATYLNAKSFVADDRSSKQAKALLRGAKKAVEFTIKKNDGSITLALFEKGKAQKSKVFATVSNLDPLFEVEPFAKERLIKDPKDLRLAKLLSSMDRFSVKRIQVQSGSAPAYSIVDQNSKWTDEGTKQAVDQVKVQDLLDRLSGKRVRDFIPSRKAPKNENEGVRIALFGDGQKQLKSLVFWKSGNQLYARDSGSKRDEVFIVDSAVTDGLPWTRDFFEIKAPGVPAAKK